MVLRIRQEKLLISQFNNINPNQPFQILEPENYVLGSFEGNINPGYP